MIGTNARPGGLDGVLAEHARTLAAAGVASPRKDAVALAEHVLGAAPAPGAGIDVPAPAQAARLAALVERRAAGEPLQHILGRTWFRELELACRPGVFVPRPETEVVAGFAIDAARAAGAGAIVVDLCTGTGAVALSVAAEVVGARVVATDLDASAVALARANLAALESGVAGVPGPAAGATVEILRGDLLEPLDPGMRGRVDVVVSNPPYLPESDRPALPPDVAADPPAALFGGTDGLDLVRRILGAAPEWLRPGGTIVLEIDSRSAAAAASIAAAAGLSDVRVESDLTGRDRVLTAGRPEEEST